jgi:hypothetical protein
MKKLLINILIATYAIAAKTECLKESDSSAILCGNTLCDNIGGICIKEGDYHKCSCNTEYTTQGEIICNYKKTSKLSSFFIELILPIGIGHIYAKRYAHGFIKLLLSLLILSTFRTKNYINQISILTFSIMCFIDIIGFISGLYKDGNNLPFY